MQIEQTVQKEIMRIAKGTILGTILMYIGFGIGHFALPELIPLDYRVILAGAAGAAVAIGNFVGLAVTVQNIANDPDPAEGKRRMQKSSSLLLTLLLPSIQKSQKVPLLPNSHRKVWSAMSTLMPKQQRVHP